MFSMSTCIYDEHHLCSSLVDLKGVLDKTVPHQHRTHSRPTVHHKRWDPFYRKHFVAFTPI